MDLTTQEHSIYRAILLKMRGPDFVLGIDDAIKGLSRPQKHGLLAYNDGYGFAYAIQEEVSHAKD